MHNVLTQIMDKMNKFDIVTPEWIRGQLLTKDMNNRELAKGVNVSDSQISQWLSGNKKPTRAAKAAIYYFFERH